MNITNIIWGGWFQGCFSHIHNHIFEINFLLFYLPILKWVVYWIIFTFFIHFGVCSREVMMFYVKDFFWAATIKSFRIMITKCVWECRHRYKSWPHTKVPIKRTHTTSSLWLIQRKTITQLFSKRREKKFRHHYC